MRMGEDTGGLVWGGGYSGVALALWMVVVVVVAEMVVIS